MPALPRINSELLREHAARLRFVPREAARRQLENAERLAREVFEDVARERGKAYPAAWVMMRLVGHEGAGKGVEGVIVGEALLADLSALVEHLSVAARLSAREHATGAAQDDGVWLSVKQLSARWGVSRKTLERDRKKGLFARRVFAGAEGEASNNGKRSAGARLGTLVYARDTVELFERLRASTRTSADVDAQRTTPGAGGERRRGAAGAASMSAEERAWVIESAAAAAGRALGNDERSGATGETLAKLCARLGGEIGRSAEAIRRVIRAHEKSTGTALFATRKRRGRGAAKRKEVAARVVKGERAARVAKEQAISRASVYRLGLEERLARLRGIAWPPVVAGPMFTREEAGEVLLGAAVREAGLRGDWPRTVEGIVSEGREQHAADRAVETARAVAMQFLVWRARRDVGTLAPGSARAAARAEEIETGLLWASRLKVELVRSQLGLIVRTIEGDEGDRRLLESSALRAAEALGACIASASAAVDRFDPFKGGRLAGTVNLAVAKTVAGLVSELRRASTGGGVGMKASRLGAEGSALREAEARLASWGRRVHAWQEFLEPEERVRGCVMAMADNDPARRVMELRYAWRAAGPGERSADAPRTSEDVAGELGLSVMRVRALERGVFRDALGAASPASGESER